MPAGMCSFKGIKKKKKRFKVDLQRKLLRQHCKWEYIHFSPYTYFQRKGGEACSYGKYLLRLVSRLFSVTCSNLCDKIIGLLLLVRAIQLGACSGQASHHCCNSDPFWYCYVNNSHTDSFDNSCKGREQLQSAKVSWMHVWRVGC